jgi:hypothetical protein
VGVQIKFAHELEVIEVDGDLLSVVNQLNVSMANGNKFTVFTERDGGEVAVEMQNITFMRSTDGDNAFIS